MAKLNWNARPQYQPNDPDRNFIPLDPWPSPRGVEAANSLRGRQAKSLHDRAMPVALPKLKFMEDAEAQK